VAEALGQIPPRDAGAKPEENGFDEQTIVRRGAADMAFPARQNIFDPIPLVVAQCITSHRSALLGRPLKSQTFADSGIPRVSETQSVPRPIPIRSPLN
jgi:hypothetical protein